MKDIQAQIDAIVKRLDAIENSMIRGSKIGNPSILDLKDARDAAVETARYIKSRHYSEHAMGGQWHNEAFRKQYLALQGKARELNYKIALMI